jgi:cell division protein FtsI (penicillin-binding protein 3)
MNNKRVLFIIVSVFIFFLLIAFRLFNVQILRNEELKYLAERQQTKVEKISAERGLIYDRNNILLAYNRNDVSWFVDLRMVGKAGKKKIASEFSKAFGRTQKYYLDLMDETGRNICLEKKASAEKSLPLKELKIPGLFNVEDPTRIYAYNNLASHLLGYVSNEYEGTAGLEKALDQYLHGDDGTMLVQRNAIGDVITVEEEKTKPSSAGENIVLTINKNYQSILEDELASGLQAYGGSYAMGIIMDPNNGEILAMANKQDYDPNQYWKYNDSTRRNKILTDTYEPGSTFKGITMSALLDQKLVREDEQVNISGGRYKFNTVYINDSHHGPASLTVKGVIEQSSNVGMSKLAQRIDDEIFYKYLRGFGFGSSTALGLPGEESGSLKKPNKWSPITKAFVSFGYELSVTALQLVTAYSAIINGGTLYQPQIIKSRLGSNGALLYQDTPKPVRSVISKETSMKMREFLRGVVEKGTGKNAKLSMVSVGGKTGTSQKLVNGSYSKSNYNSSFIGFFPVEDPKIICLIVFNSPSKGYYGGSVAAPLFKNTAEKIIESDASLFKEIKNAPEIKNETIAKMQVVPVVSKQVNNGSAAALAPGIMPDLSKLTLREAITLMGKFGLKSQVSGSGKVVSQSITPGEKIYKGEVCRITCGEEKINGSMIY